MKLISLSIRCPHVIIDSNNDYDAQFLCDGLHIHWPYSSAEVVVIDPISKIDVSIMTITTCRMFVDLLDTSEYMRLFLQKTSQKDLRLSRVVGGEV